MTISFQPGHRAVVIGAGAIGTAVCAGFAQAGAAVLVVDVDGDAAATVAGGLFGGGHHNAQVDVTDLDAVCTLSQAATAGGEMVSSVVYTAGVAPTFDVLEFDWDAYRATMAVNLDGALHVAHAFGRVMAAARSGSMSFVSSVAGKQGAAGAAAYCASKFALRGIVECLAAEVGRWGLRANAICPGEVDTPMLAQVAAAQGARRGTSAAVELEAMRVSSAMRRLVTPEEVAGVAVWLASDAASGITGASVDVTAGLGLI